MIPGLGNDDRWRMVEDEFVAVAHKFTVHLHAAEYQRLTEKAKNQNTDAIRSLSRPVAGPMTDRVKRRQAALALKKSQTTSIKRAFARTQDVELDDGDELPWAGTSLQGLMESPHKKRVSLAKVVSATSDTRAAALSRKDSSASVARTTYRSGSSSRTDPLALVGNRSVRPYQDDSDDDMAGQGTAIARPVRSLAMSSSVAISQRPSSTAPARIVKAPAAVPQPVAAPTLSVLDDDSDSSVDLLFGFGNRHKRGIARRTRS